MGPAAHKPRLDRAQMDVEDFRDLFVAEAFDIAQDDHGLEWLGHLANGSFYLLAHLCVCREIEGRFVLIDQRVLETEGFAILGREFLLNSDFLALVAAPPAALIGGFMQGDAVDPGAQAGVAMKIADAAVDLDEDILGDVGGFAGVGNGARDERVERAVILSDQRGEGLFRPCLQLGDNRRLVRPGCRLRSENIRKITQCCPRLHSNVPHTLEDFTVSW